MQKQKELQIAEGVSLPLDIVTQTIAILAKRRVGKSYTMRRIVEQLFENQQQVILVDPKGDQWGIRSSKDGKKPGYPIVIFGGEHGDVPLEVNSGEIVAKLAVEERVSILLDLSIFRKHEIATFMAIFLENLYRLKAQEKYRTPCMVVLDEGDAIAPQKPQRGEERMLGAVEDIVRRGGQRGIGCILVTQRSAVLNKNVLTQSQMLVVLRTIAPQDLSAMKAWIDVHGDLEQGKQLMDSLPSLPIGDAWFWSPGWPTDKGLFIRSHVLPITTFDSAATPKPGEKKVVPKNLADVDLDALKNQMASTIQNAKENDPKQLKKRVLELETIIKNSKLGDSPQKNVEIDLEKSLEPHLMAFRSIEQGYKNRMEFFNDHINAIREVTNSFTIAMRELDTQRPKLTAPASYTPTPVKPIKKVTGADVTHGSVVIRYNKPADFKVVEDGLEIKNVQGSALRMLQVLVSRYPIRLTRVQLGTFAKLKSTTGSFSTYMSALKTNGYIVVDGNLISASQKGIEYIGEAPNPPQTSEDVINMWKGNLNGGAKRIFEALLSVYPNGLSKEELGETLGMLHTTGSFSTYLSILRTNGLITTVDGRLEISSSLFI